MRIKVGRTMAIILLVRSELEKQHQSTPIEDLTIEMVPDEIVEKVNNSPIWDTITDKKDEERVKAGAIVLLHEGRKYKILQDNKNQLGFRELMEAKNMLDPEAADLLELEGECIFYRLEPEWKHEPVLYTPEHYA